MVVFGTNLRQLGVAMAMAALLAFVLHDSFSPHAHAAPGVSIGTQAQDRAHAHKNAHENANDHAHAHEQTGLPLDVVDRSCEGECCGLACAIALPGASVANIAIATGWTALCWSYDPLQHGIATDGLRRPPRPTSMS
jgi:hypothetical protein